MCKKSSVFYIYTCYHVSFIPSNIYMPVPGVSSSVENCSCPESTRFCSQCVMPLSWCQFVLDGWVMAEWLGRRLQQWAAKGVSMILGSLFATGIQLMKQFAHNWYSPWCQCTESCYHVSFIQNNIYMPAPGVSSSVENHSCQESTRCLSQCLILLNWCQSVIDR